MKIIMNMFNVWMVLAVLLGGMAWGQQSPAKRAFVQSVVSLQPACQDAVIDLTGTMTCQDSRAAVDKICGQTRRYLEDWLSDEDWELEGSGTVPGVMVLSLELSGVTSQKQEVVSTAGRSYVTYFAMLVRVNQVQNGVQRKLDYTPRISVSSVSADVVLTEKIRVDLMKQGIDKLMKSLQDGTAQAVAPVVAQPVPGTVTAAPSNRVVAPYGGVMVQPGVRMAPVPGYSVQPSYRVVPGGQVVVPSNGIVVPSARVIYPGRRIR